MRAIFGFAPPWILIFLATQLLVTQTARSLAYLLNLRVSIRGNHHYLFGSRDRPPRRCPTFALWLQPVRWWDRKCLTGSYLLFNEYLRVRNACFRLQRAAIRVTDNIISAISILAALNRIAADHVINTIRHPSQLQRQIHLNSRSALAHLRRIALRALFTAVTALAWAVHTTHAATDPVTQANGTPAQPSRAAPTQPPRRRVGHAKALPGVNARARGRPTWRSNLSVRRWDHFVIDSGCTWHMHNVLEDLINVRPCTDVVEDANGNVTHIDWVGDLPVAALSRDNVEYRVLLRGVRYSPTLADTLISIDQLWQTAKISSVFDDARSLVFRNNVLSNGQELTLPFRRESGLFLWSVAILAPDVLKSRSSRQASEPETRRRAARSRRPAQKPNRNCLGSTCSLKSGVHAAGATSHVSALPADHAAAVLHRRLHVSLEYIRRLADHSHDAPAHLSSAAHLTCQHCVEANAPRLSHSSTDAYQPTHAGRLIHADIVGPFRRSTHGHLQYALILTDDHTRFKFVYLLRRKSDAPDAVRKFLSRFNAHASVNSGLPVRLVGSLHTDNAGEFISRDFADLLDQNLIAMTTCPPHVHQLNGVAERSIRSVMALARSYLTAGSVDVGHWPHALEMAVDVLNRTTGPKPLGSGTGPTSYQMLTGTKPRVMNIMPFGCSAFAVKPRSQYSKTTIDPRAWVGYNLGRSVTSPGAYKIYVPTTGRIVVTSDAYFMEGTFPCRPRGEQRDELPEMPTSPPPPDGQPPGVPNAFATPEPDARSLTVPPSSAQVTDSDPAPDTEDPSLASLGDAGRAATMGSVAAEFDASTGRGVTARRSQRVLVLFSGNYRRPDSISAFLTRRGLSTDMVDSDAVNGGGETHNILNDAFFADLYDRVRRGEYLAVFAAPPCSTYSVSRFFKPRDGKPGPPVVRKRGDHILGLPDVPGPHRRELQQANEVTRRTAVLLTAAYRAGSEFIVENPADRGDVSMPWLFQFAEHGPIWLDPNMNDLKTACCTESVTFAQCRFGADSQKYTTLWFTSGLSPQLRPLNHLLCTHAPGTHESAAGGVQLDSGLWNSASSAAYPPDFNCFIVEAIASLAVFDTALPNVRDNAAITVPQPAAPSVDPIAATVAEPATPAADAATNDAREKPVEMTADEPAAEPAVPPASPSSPQPPRERRARQPKPVWQRGLGAINLRERKPVAYLAKRGKDDPSNFPDAVRRDKEGWMSSMLKEVLNHANNHSWSFVPRAQLPRGRHIVRLTWAFKVKRDGSKKSRLCVQGCSQVAGVDYDQTFCAAMRGASLRLLCALAGRLGLHMRRWDFVAAYLQGELLDGEVCYCSAPSGFATAVVDGVTQLVPVEQGDGVERLCRVEKPVYGMAQAGRRWQRSLFPWLLAWRGSKPTSGDLPQLRQSQMDTCVFHCHATVDTPQGPRKETLFLGCYVDDLFILSSHQDEHSLYHQLTTSLEASWEIEDEGEASDLLSVEISREGDHVTLRQTAYITRMMETYAPDGVPSFRSNLYPLKSHPAERVPAGDDLPALVLAAVEQDAKDIDPALLKAYQSLTGALLYTAVNTRPDVAYSVGLLCRAMGKPTVETYEAALRVLYYLHHHRHVGLRYGASVLDLSGMSDSDWAIRHSTTGFVFNYSLAAISWGSKKQNSIALSSCEAEIMALSEAAKEAVYLADFLGELGYPAQSTVQLATDNSGARDLAYNPEHHEKVKHIERRHFYIRELVEEQRLVVPYVATSDNLADFFTKPLSAKSFYTNRNQIMNVPPERSRAARLAAKLVRGLRSPQ